MATLTTTSRRPIPLVLLSSASPVHARLPRPCAIAQRAAATSTSTSTSSAVPLSTPTAKSSPALRHHQRRRRPLAAARAAGDDGGGNGSDADGNGTGNGADANPVDAARDSWDEADGPLTEAEIEAAAARDAEAAADALLDPAWRSLRRAVVDEARAAGADDAEAERLASMSLSEALDNDTLLKGLAERELGPILEAMGLPRSQALPFFFDLVRLAAGAQLAAAAAVFYGAEWGFGLGPGDAWRCVLGLLLGYAARLAIPVEALAWPIYDGLVKAATGGQGYYEPGAGWGAAAAREQEEEEERARAEAARRRRRALAGGSGGGEGADEAAGAAGKQQDEGTDEDSSSSSSSSPLSATERQRRQALTAAVRLGALAAACASLPPALLGWSPSESAWQFAAPALAGALAFDAAYLAALVIKLREVEGGE